MSNTQNAIIHELQKSSNYLIMKMMCDLTSENVTIIKEEKRKNHSYKNVTFEQNPQQITVS